MIKGQVISGGFSKILVRQKSKQSIELGELLIGDMPDGKILLQVYDLVYGSQLSQQNLELISGMKLEEDADMELMDASLRNYTLALMKNLATIKNNDATVCKALPSFFSDVRELTKDDLSFLTKPKNPMFIGNLRSGSKVVDVPLYLEGEKVLSHHVLIPATTGRGKSLDENEEVLIKTNGTFLLKSIGELVNDNSNFKGSEAISMNPKNYSMDFKKVTKFVKHKAPRYMYKVISDSGREVLVTGDHNLYVMRNGKLALLKTNEVRDGDYLPLPLKINIKGNIERLNLFELFNEEDKIFCIPSKELYRKFKSKNDCLKILSQYYTRPLQAYNELIIKKKYKIRLPLLNKLLENKLSAEDLNSIELTDHLLSVKLNANLLLTDELLQLIGYYISEGYSINDNTFRISCSDKSVREHLKKILNKIKMNYFFINKEDGNFDMGISSSIFTKLIKKMGLGRVSHNKRLPYFFMGLSDKNLRTMLKTYFEGDGGVDRETNKQNKRFKISCTTKSKKLASDICFAIYRFGILARCKKKKSRATNSKHKGDTYYRVSISGQSNLKMFLSKVGFQFDRKNNILNGRLEYKENTNVDIIPVNPEDFKLRRVKTGLSQKEFSSRINFSQQIISLIEAGERRPSRELFESIISKFSEFDGISHLANFRWDKIKDIERIKYKKKYVYDLTIKDNKTFLAGHGGLFVHNSNLVSCILWDSLDKDYCGMLVLDPHDEYYGRNKVGLKDHPAKKNVIYYTPMDVPPGCRTLKINLEVIKPSHFNGVIEWSPAQKEALSAFYRSYDRKWIESIIMEKPVEGFNEATLGVIKRRVLNLLNLEFVNNQLFCNGVFDISAGATTIADISSELEAGKTVIIDTSNFSGAIEILIGSLIVTEVFNKYKNYKVKGLLRDKPVISVVLEEAPRVLGKEVLEKGSNIFSTIAREGRKFKVGLVAITQLPSLIPRQILANMNTKIILGTEMSAERQAIIDSASQDLSEDSRNIASLDKGEAIITSNFVKFAMPVKIPFFDEFAKKADKEIKSDFSGIIS